MFKYAMIALATTASFANPAIAKSQDFRASPVVIADTVNHIMALSPLQSAISGVASSNSININKAGAVFIKVHFVYWLACR
jgi:hypothetical protein